jgi:hypothetical protein
MFRAALEHLEETGGGGGMRSLGRSQPHVFMANPGYHIPALIAWIGHENMGIVDEHCGRRPLMAASYQLDGSIIAA